MGAIPFKPNRSGASNSEPNGDKIPESRPRIEQPLPAAEVLNEIPLKIRKKPVPLGRKEPGVPYGLSLEFDEEIEAYIAKAVNLVPEGNRPRFESGLRGLFAKALDERQSADTELPTTAPELWSGRDRRNKETPLDFVKRAYEPWFNRGLRRAHLRELDPSLYDAVSKWIERHPEDENGHFFEKARATSDQVDKKLAELGISDPADAFVCSPNNRKEAARLYQAANWRRQHGN